MKLGGSPRRRISKSRTRRTSAKRTSRTSAKQKKRVTANMKTSSSFGIPTGWVPYFGSQIPFVNPPQWDVPYTNDQAQLIKTGKY